MNKRQQLVQQAFLNNEEEIISRLEAIYGESLAGITKKVKVLDSSIAQLQKALGDITEDEIGGLALAVLKKKNLTPAEAQETIRSMIQAKVYQKQYQEALKKQVGGVLDKMGEKQYTTVSDYLTGCYQDGFIGTMYDLQGQGIPLCMPIDQESVVRAVQLDSKISKGLYTRLGEDVTALKRKIAAQISRGVSSGLTYRQMADQLAGETRIGFNNAVRIARTEGHRIQCQAGMDACEKAREKGCDVLKQWDATLDGNTRESHSQVDGEIRELDKPFSNGLMFPGDPSGGAAEVINCRCALLQRASWELDEEELEELKKRAEYFGLDKTASFEEYREKYLRSAEQAPFIDNPFVMVDDAPPMLREFTNVQDYRRAMDDYARKHPDIDPREFYVENSNWYGLHDEAERANVKHFDSTIRQLQDDFPLPSNADEVFVGTFDGVENQLSDIQRSRFEHTQDAAAQLWTNNNKTVIAFKPEQASGTFIDDLAKRQKAIDNDEILETIFGSSPEGTAIHEWGHALSDYLMDGMTRDDPNSVEFWNWYKSLSKDDIARGLSRYAATNLDEFQAECFAELLSGNPRAIARKYAEFLEKASGGRINFSNVLTKTGNSGIMQMGNQDVRRWYVERVSRIADAIDPTLPIDVRARLAFEARNAVRTEARELMADQALRRTLDQVHPNKTFEELVESKMKRKGLTREEAIQDVYDTATKTNADINRELGIGGE